MYFAFTLAATTSFPLSSTRRNLAPRRHRASIEVRSRTAAQCGTLRMPIARRSLSRIALEKFDAVEDVEEVHSKFHLGAANKMSITFLIAVHCFRCLFRFEDIAQEKITILICKSISP